MKKQINQAREKQLLDIEIEILELSKKMLAAFQRHRPGDALEFLNDAVALSREKLSLHRMTVAEWEDLQPSRASDDLNFLS